MAATKMKSVVFSAEEVRDALAGGRVFRRKVKPQPPEHVLVPLWMKDANALTCGEYEASCPFDCGERVWVKEKCRAMTGLRAVPPIPFTASRFTLTIKSISVEQVNGTWEWVIGYELEQTKQ